MKIKVLAFFFSLVLIVFGILIYYWFYVGILKDHYVVFDSKNNQYKIVNEQPKNWVKLQDISRYGKWAIVISEDWAFFDHNGLDFNQIESVIEESLEEGKLVRGASTITQQVVKNAFLSNKKSLIRKIKEAYLALAIEHHLSKSQILEQYLNLVELGENIYGIKSASQYYFKKHPSELTAKEASFLAMLLPSPRRYAESFRRRRLTDFATDQISDILVKLRQAEIMSEEQRIMAEVEILPFEVMNHFDEQSFDINAEGYVEDDSSEILVDDLPGI